MHGEPSKGFWKLQSYKVFFTERLFRLRLGGHHDSEDPPRPIATDAARTSTASPPPPPPPPPPALRGADADPATVPVPLPVVASATTEDRSSKPNPERETVAAVPDSKSTTSIHPPLNTTDNEAGPDTASDDSVDRMFAEAWQKPNNGPPVAWSSRGQRIPECRRRIPRRGLEGEMNNIGTHTIRNNATDRSICTA
ncbi:hypothetical protein B0H66DRAFT_357014 [Apodospora peruviana]|uniref:Uncharacterized protein n=1 Tax=Apodospora peruviana TaxID=516989 RepID=A0AAE0HVC6_9PEZI|nr:hypothetical protein B0H66DRAFT_357014 [Apodospora peruviana]